MSRRLKLFIAASFILNIALIGVIAGHGYHRYGVKRGDQLMALLDRSSIVEEKRHLIKEKLKDNFHNEDEWKGKEEWRSTTRAILTAEKFDADAYRAQLNKMVSRRNANKQNRVDIIVEIASNLDQNERIALADIFRRSRK